MLVPITVMAIHPLLTVTAIRVFMPTLPNAVGDDTNRGRGFDGLSLTLNGISDDTNLGEVKVRTFTACRLVKTPTGRRLRQAQPDTPVVVT